LTFPVFAQQLTQDDVQNQRLDELFRRYDSLTAGQNQLNQNVANLEQNMQQTVQRFDNSVSQLSATVAQLAAILNQNQQSRAFRTEALSTGDAFVNNAPLPSNASPSSFASPSSIFPHPATPSAGISGNASATPGVLIQPQPVAGATLAPITSVTTVSPIQQPVQQVPTLNTGVSNIVVTPLPVAVYGTPSGVNTAPSGTTLPVISSGGTLAPSGASGTVISAVAPVQSGITHVYQSTPAFGIQNVSGSSSSLPTGSFSPPAFPSTQSQLPTARYLQVGAYTDYTLAGRHASLLRGLSYPVSERQEGIWLKLLIGPMPIEQINAIKTRLDAQGINSFVTQ